MRFLISRQATTAGRRWHSFLVTDGSFITAAERWMVSRFVSSAPTMRDPFTTTTKGSTQSFCWLWLMRTTAFGGLTLVRQVPQAIPQVFNNSDFKEAIVDGTLRLPPPEPLPHDDKPMPYFIVADDAFALRTWLMKPFSLRNLSERERVFNYRLSRARRIVENAFGILAHRFRCFLGTLQQEPETISSIVMACVCLHNFLRQRNPRQLEAVDQEGPDHEIIPGAWRNDQ